MTVRARIASSVSSAIYKDSRDVWQNILLRVSINEKKMKAYHGNSKRNSLVLPLFWPVFQDPLLPPGVPTYHHYRHTGKS